MTETAQRKIGFTWRHLTLMLVAGAVLAAAGFGFGVFSIEVNQQNSLLGWLDEADPATGPDGLSPGESTVADLRARFGLPQVKLDQPAARLQLVYPELQFADDLARLKATVDVSGPRFAPLLLVGTAEISALDLLKQGALDQERLLALHVEPGEPMDHERVLYSYGRPALTMGLPPSSSEPGDTAWMYPRKGLMVIFSEQQATRFLYEGGAATTASSGTI